MIGAMNSQANLEGTIYARASLVGDVSSRCVMGDISVGRVIVEQSDTEPYEGEYVVTPLANAQILDTSNKKMMSDIEVRAIPYYDVSNDYGRTIYIGGDM